MSKDTKKQDSGIIKDDLLGRDEFRKSKIGYFLGFSAIPKIVKGTFSPVLSGFGIFSKFIKMVFPKKPELTELSYITDDYERFIQAMSKFSISESDLPSIERRNQVSAVFYFILSVIALMWGNYVVSSDYFNPSFVFDYIFPFFPLFATIPLFFKHSFWRYQIASKKLVSFKDFFSNPLNWIPFKMSGGLGGNMKLTSLFILTTAFSMMFANSALAFSVTDTLGDEDLFYQLLQFIAPIGPVEIGAMGESPWSGPLGAAFRAFNTTLLTVGSMMLGWHTIAGTVASAYEGQVMGQRWHTIWAPVRVTAGIGSLAPVASGFCAAQVLIMQLIVWGGGIANEVWGGYLDYFDTDAAIFSNPVDVNAPLGDSDIVAFSRNQSAKTFVMGVLQKEVCMAGLQEVYIDTARDIYPNEDFRNLNSDQLAEVGNSIVGGWNSFWSFDSTQTASASQILSGPQIYVDDRGGSSTLRVANNNPGVDPYAYAYTGATAVLDVPTPVVVMDYGESCGTVSLDISDMEFVKRYMAQNATDSIQVEGNPYDDIRPVDDSQNARVLNEIRGSADQLSISLSDIRTFILQDVAFEFVNASKGDPDSMDFIQSGGEIEQRLVEAFIAYRQALIQATVSNLGTISSWTRAGDEDTLVTAMKDKGWASSGAFYVLLAKIQQMNMSVGNYTPNITSVDVASVMNNHRNARDILIGGNQQSEYGIFPLYDVFAETAFKSNSDLILNDVLSVEDDPSSYLKYLTNSLTNTLYDTVFTRFNPDPYNAMLDLADMGHKIVTYTTYAILIFFGLSLVSSSVMGFLGGPATGGVGGMLSGVMDALGPIIGLLKMAMFLVLGVGVVHAYVLPMMPFILMTFFVMGMLVLVAEALVAAPIWAFFHVRLDGQDFVDQVQRPGYMIAFNLLLRPALAVFGLILSFTIFGSIIWFINETFSIAGKSLMIGDHSSIVGGLVMLVLLTYLHYQVAIRSFTLITQVPDRVARWFGQGGENLGEQGDAEKQTSIVAGQLTNRTEGMSKMGGAGAAAKAMGGIGAGPIAGGAAAAAKSIK